MLKCALQNITTEEPHSEEGLTEIALCYHLGHRGSKSILIATAGQGRGVNARKAAALADLGGLFV